jgi:hypothetical protein
MRFSSQTKKEFGIAIISATTKEFLAEKLARLQVLMSADGLRYDHVVPIYKNYQCLKITFTIPIYPVRTHGD